MKEKNLNHTDLSSKELEILKDLYINQKVKSMNINDLKNFVTENITLQIKSTIGNDEELEAWKEMESFFEEEFQNIIREITIKMRSDRIKQDNLSIEQSNYQSEDKKEVKKLDMWED